MLADQDIRRVALVTGASRNLGREFALALAREGVRVGIGYAKNHRMAEETVGLIKRAGGSAITTELDLRDEGSIRAAVSSLVSWGGRLDILVNNAAVYEDATIWKMGLEQWRKVIDIDLTGAFLCIKHASAEMRKDRWGRIVNISSIVGQEPVFGVSNYAAAKAGLEGLTRAGAMDLIRFGITVNCIALGYFDRGMMSRLPEDIQKRIIETIPMGRVGNAIEAASSVAYLCSSNAGYITGQVISVNGGLSF